MLHRLSVGLVVVVAGLSLSVAYTGCSQAPTTPASQASRLMSTLSAFTEEGYPCISPFPALTGPQEKAKDPWHAQKALITTCAQFSAWIDTVKQELEAYKNALGDSGIEQNVKAAVQRALDNLDGTKCTNEANLEDSKRNADLLLRPVLVVQTAAKFWNAGFRLYAQFTIALLLNGQLEFPTDLIKEALDFMIEGAKAADNKEGEKTLKEIKKLVEDVEKCKEALDKLREALQKVQQLFGS